MPKTRTYAAPVIIFFILTLFTFAASFFSMYFVVNVYSSMVNDLGFIIVFVLFFPFIIALIIASFPITIASLITSSCIVGKTSSVKIRNLAIATIVITVTTIIMSIISIAIIAANGAVEEPSTSETALRLVSTLLH